jgi:hypothetical protein
MWRPYWLDRALPITFPMGTLLLTALAALLGYGLGKGVPQLVQRSGSLARRSQTSELAFAGLLLTPWVVGAVGVLMLFTKPWLLIPLVGYGAGMAWGRRRIGL